MNIILMILLLLMVAIITVIASFDFHPDKNKSLIKKYSSNGRQSKSVTEMLEIYPGFHLFWDLISLLMMVWVACVATSLWGVMMGSVLALALIALAQLLGQRVVVVTDELLVRHSAQIVKYFNWTRIFGRLVVDRSNEPIVDVDELIKVVKASKIDCPTQIAIEKTIAMQSAPVSKLMVKWADVKKVGHREKLTPGHIDELFQSRQKIFPVIRNNDDDVVGLLYLSDIQTIGQTEKKLVDSMHRNFACCEHDMPIPEIMRQMAANETTVAVVTKNKKVCGLINLADILASDPYCN